jgi:elongation factor G
MFADVTVDFEPSAAGVEVSLPDGLQVADGGIGSGVPLGYLAGLAEGIRAGLAAGRPDLMTATLVVVRRVQVHPVDSSVVSFRAAGRIAARQALDQAGRAAHRAKGDAP